MSGHYLLPNRQRGLTLIPAIITVFIFTLITVQIIIPQQSRTLNENRLNTMTNTAEQLIQAAMSYRSDPSNNQRWPQTIAMLTPKYLPLFNNRTPWDGTWEFIEQTSGIGLILKTNTGSTANALSLVSKIGSHASIDPDGTSVLISVVLPVDHYVQTLNVGQLVAGNIIEDDTLLGQVIEVPLIPPTYEAELDYLIVKRQLTMGATGYSPKIQVAGGNPLAFEGSINFTGPINIAGTLTAKQIIEQDQGGSSRRYKKNIQPLEIEANKIYQLQTVSYDYRDTYKHYQKQLGGGRQVGLIAEQIDGIIPELAIYQDGQPVNVDYEKLTVVMLKALQALKQDFSALQAENKALKAQVETVVKMPQSP
jgi:hypothetical protein